MCTIRFVNPLSARLGSLHAGFTRTCLLYVIFFGTGVGLVLPGAMLPLLVARWRLLDQEAGALLFLLFIGSVVGAVFSRGALSVSIARGCIATVVGASALTITFVPGAFAAMFLYGTGLGMVMTSISLLQARRYASDSRAEMARLNLTWSIGACVGPWLALNGTCRFGQSLVLFAIAAFFLLCGPLALVYAPVLDTSAVARSTSYGRQSSFSLILLTMVALSTGIEAATGGWLAIFSQRFGNALDATIGAVTCFWCGIFVSRLAQSYQRFSVVFSRHLVVLGPALMSLGLCVILFARYGSEISVGALLLGLGVGPMYPLLLASVLQRGEKGNAVFIVAGCGSSLFPLVIGAVSGRLGSIRAGISISLAGAFLLTAFGYASRHSAFSSLDTGTPKS